ncbi:hypothetical protein MKX01_028731, partial [Papaver californicum]
AGIILTLNVISVLRMDMFFIRPIKKSNFGYELLANESSLGNPALLTWHRAVLLLFIVQPKQYLALGDWSSRK